MLECLTRSRRAGYDNGGYSLVELIVIISIMAIAVGIMGLSVSVMFAKDGERAAKLIDDKLSEVRLASMSKPGLYVMKIDTVRSGKENTITITRTTDTTLPSDLALPADETTTFKIDKDAYILFGPQDSEWKDPKATEAKYGTIEIMFDKANGSVKSITTSYGVTFNPEKIYEFRCYSARRTSSMKTIELMPVTGRHYIR